MQGWEGGGESGREWPSGCVPFAGGNPLLVFRETSQELLHASRFILGSSERAAFCIMLAGELNKNGMQIQVAGGHQTPWESAGFLDWRTGEFKTTSSRYYRAGICT